MKTCLRCGEWSPARARFCSACGAELASAPAPTERRKVITVLFADVAGSTALGERVDSETLRWAMQRWFERMRDVIEAHGGIVEKYIGDAVMAVFGVPVTHEDDALRAVRAAAEMREQAAALRDELLGERGVEFGMRVGINTGLATTGAAPDGGNFSSGDMVNVAARYEQAAGVGDILIGPETLRLVGHAVTAEPVAPLLLKGKTKPVEAFRLGTVARDAHTRAPRARAPMVGRGQERQGLFEAFDRALDERRPQLVTVLGAAGIGKSRLVAEVAGSLNQAATVATGRCLPYGEGLTWWPLGEALEVDVLGGRAPAFLRAAAVLRGDPVAREDAFWAMRTVLETLARRRPFVLVIEDLHWADATLLEFLEHLVDVATGTPLLVVATARPELPRTFAVDRRRATTMALGPLTPVESDELLRHLVGSAGISDRAAGRILGVADGYPLFLEEVVAMLADDGALGAGAESEIAVPPTIQTLITARLDRLAPAEREVIEAAAVVGKEFSGAHVAALLDGEGAAAVHLRALAERELVVPAGEDAYRFAHQLVRDTAYAGMAKHRRAQLHERFADALVGGAVPEELLGFHLEHAVLLRRDLGESELATATLAARAIASLTRAGRRADQRSDPGVAVALFERGLRLADAGARSALLPLLGAALYQCGRMEEAKATLDRAEAEAGNETDRAIARIEREWVRLEVEAGGGREAARAVAVAARATLGPTGERRGVGQAWMLEAYVDWIAGRVADCDRALVQAAAIARACGDARNESVALGMRAAGFVWGPVPVADGIAGCAALRPRVSGSPAKLFWIVAPLAVLHAMHGDFDAAQAHLDEAAGLSGRLRSVHDTATQHEAQVWRITGDLERAEAALRPGVEALAGLSEGGLLATARAMLAQILFEQGRHGEASDLALAAAAGSAPDDCSTQVIWRGVRAKVLAREGREAEAERLAREAVALASATDLLWVHGDAMLDLAEVLGRAGDTAGAERAALEGQALFARKGHVVAAAQARSLVTNRSGRQ